MLMTVNCSKPNISDSLEPKTVLTVNNLTLRLSSKFRGCKNVKEMVNVTQVGEGCGELYERDGC